MPQVIDGKEVTFEEREKTEQMFSGADLHQSPLYYLCSEPRVEKVPFQGHMAVPHGSRALEN